MRVHRRRFLQWVGGTGLVLGSGRWNSRAHAAELWGGPYWVFVHAAGGWDPTMLCDPKGKTSDKALSPINNFLVDEIVEVGPFRVAPVNGHEEFFSRFQDDLLVINGIDCQTVSHETGARHIWSGSTTPDFPAFAALAAASLDAPPTLGFLSNGGYDRTAGLVAPTRIPDVDAIEELAYPNRIDSSDEASTLFTESMLGRITDERVARLARQRESASLPRTARAMDMLAAARGGENELIELSNYLPDTIDNSSNQLFRQAQVAMACFRAGVSVSANLSVGGFDTHGNHDIDQASALEGLLAGVAYIVDEAERQGIADQVRIVVSSEFGRTPWYNDTNGKDHWAVTSMMLMGNGIQGGRVIGATYDDVTPHPIDPVTLDLDEKGVRITPGNIHAALRELAGIEDHAVVVPFEVGDSLPLLTG